MTGIDRTGSGVKTLPELLAAWRVLHDRQDAAADAAFRDLAVAARLHVPPDVIRRDLEKRLAALPDGATPNEVHAVFASAAKDGRPWEPPPPPVVAVNDWTGECDRPEWVVEEWLPAGRVALLSGPGGEGKSKLALQLCVAVATGGGQMVPGGPKIAERGPALFASWEDSRSDILFRLNDRPEGTSGLDSLWYSDMATHGPLWAPAAGGSRHTSTLGVLTDAGRMLRGEAAARRCRLLVIDPLAAAYACDENNRGLVRGFMADWDAWARAHGCAVLMIGHPPKSGADFSGSTDWHGAARAVWTMGREGDGKRVQERRMKLQCVKSNYSIKGAPLELSSWTWWQAAPWHDETSGGDRRGSVARDRSLFTESPEHV